MTTRDPRSGEQPSVIPAGDGNRELTQSLEAEPEADGQRGPDTRALELAFGTHDQPRTHAEPADPEPADPEPADPEPADPEPAGPRRAAPDGIDDLIGALLGSYRVIELLGKGGMGHVYRAEHIKLGREVALKLLRRDYASRRDAVARFFQEARTVNRVRHRNIVDVTDLVELDDGTTYIIMELLTGDSLAVWAARAIEQARVIAVLIQICDGLAAAHEIGVVHRDLKPDNVIIVPAPGGGELAKLLDFGVAKLLHHDDEDVGVVTAAGSVIGTPAYMSPEQAGGMVIDARSDIYALGAIMYELFCGQPMFRGRSFGEYVRKHLTEEPVPPRETPGGAGLDPALEAIIVRCIDKDPDRRFATILELRESLLRLLAGADGWPSGPAVSSQAPAAAPSWIFTPAPGVPRVDHASDSARSSHLSGPSRVDHSSAHPSAYPSAYPSAHPSAHPSGGAHPFPSPGISRIDHPPAYPSGDAHLFPSSGISRIERASTSQSPRWWPWLLGATLVGLGAGTAAWYATLDTPTATRAIDQAAIAPQAPQTASSPAQAARPSRSTDTAPSSPRARQAGEPAPSTSTASTRAASSETASPRPIEVRFDSQPSGDVFEAGQSGERCRTPCAVQIDLADGGPTDLRVFVVKRAGYVDGHVIVDLAGDPARAPRDYRVVLRRAEPPRAPVPAPEPRPDRQVPAQPAPPGHREASPRAPIPGAGPIEPTDTLDPFRKK